MCPVNIHEQQNEEAIPTKKILHKKQQTKRPAPRRRAWLHLASYHDPSTTSLATQFYQRTSQKYNLRHFTAIDVACMLKAPFACVLRNTNICVFV